MKTLKTTCLLLLLLLATPLAAQVEIDQKALLGSWKLNKAPLELTLKFAKGGKLEQKMIISSAEMQGSIRMTLTGTWEATADSISIGVDPESIAVKYMGQNSQIGDMVEQGFRANRDKMLEQFGGKTQVLRNVIVADDLLIFTQQIPAIPGMSEAREEKVVMTREK
ncbi:MAG: hypothetical protein J6N92_03220 [Alloprevotella sp.]|nr:hypothetical protein [Alloprevotella sp.]